MDRRKFLTSVSIAGITGIAGCSDPQETTNTPENKTKTEQTETPEEVVNKEPGWSPPPGSYIPAQRDEVKYFGDARDEWGRVLLAAVPPQEYWDVKGNTTKKQTPADKDTVHLMATVRGEDGILSPDVEVGITVFKDDEQLMEIQPQPMLSQQIGYHFGENISLRGDATYRFDVSVTDPSSVISNNLSEGFSESKVSIDISGDPANPELPFRQLPNDDYGNAGAMSPTQVGGAKVYKNPVYSENENTTEIQYTDDIGMTVQVNDDTDSLGFKGKQTLMAFTQTRYNKFPLPRAELEVTVSRDGKEVFTTPLESAIFRGGLYYGAGTPEEVQQGDKVTVSFVTPPQVARHQGYETAFLELGDLSFTLP